jgi:hypothetical protein
VACSGSGAAGATRPADGPAGASGGRAAERHGPASRLAAAPAAKGRRAGGRQKRQAPPCGRAPWRACASSSWAWGGRSCRAAGRPPPGPCGGWGAQEGCRCQGKGRGHSLLSQGVQRRRGGQARAAARLQPAHGKLRRPHGCSSPGAKRPRLRTACWWGAAGLCTRRPGRCRRPQRPGRPCPAGGAWWRWWWVWFWFWWF